jgi:uncharacterized protein (TIGR02231 family)
VTDSIESRAVEITFFEDRAQVRRTATVTLQAGQQEVSIAGVTLLVDDTTLVARIRGEGDARVLTSRVRRRMRTVAVATEDEIESLEEKQLQAWQALEEARVELTLTKNQRDRVVGLEQSLLRAMYPVPTGENTGAEQWRGAFEKLVASAEELDGQYAEAVEAVAERRRAESRARVLLEQAKMEKPEIESTVEVQIEAEQEGSYELELEYYTPCALWRPSHIARLAGDRKSMSLRMFGTVWQQTGEVWNNVKCRFSTARPTQAAEAPLLREDVLYARPKTEQERRVVQVEARDVDIASTGSERAGQVDEMPGVDDGGEPLTLVAVENVSIPSTGEPFRVEVNQAQVDCETGLVAYPERSSVPFLRARGVWEHDIPVLAGPVVVMRGNEYAGRSRIDFVPPGERFELGFGVDSGISLHRSLDDEHKTTAVTGKNILHRTIKIFVSNLSDERRYLNVLERVPVSELEEVTVKKIQSEVTPDEDGFVEFAVELEPREVRTHEIRYRVEYGSKVRLTW